MGEGVLLAGEAGDEATTAHEPAVFESPQRPLQVAPGEAQRVVEGEAAEHHPVAAQQHFGHRLREILTVGRVLGAAVEVGPRRHQRPPAGRRGRGGPRAA